MINKYFYSSLLIVLSFVLAAQEHVQTFSNEIVELDTFYNIYVIEDNCHWLENTSSEATIDWIENQNKRSKKYLSRVVNKTSSFKAINRYIYTEYDNPIKDGKYYFKYAFYNDLGVPALFYQTSLKSAPEIIVNPNFISKNDKITLKGYSVSKDSEYLAYQFSRNGSDWAEVKIVTLNHKEHKKDHLKGLKFSNIAWLGDGFFYSTIAQSGDFGKTIGQKVYYHKMDTEQSEDKLIFERKRNPSAQFSYITTSNERFFILKERNEKAGKINVFYIDYNSDIHSLRPLITNLNYDINIIDSHDGKFIATTSHNSNNGSIVEIDPENSLEWRSIALEFSEALLLKVIPFKDRVVAIYQSDQRPILTVLDYAGTLLYSLEFPVATSVSGFSGNFYDDEFLFNFSSYTVPPIVYKFNTKTFKKELTKMTTVTFDFNKIEYKQIEFLTKDSVNVPMILVYQKGIEFDGENPTILEAYGGFGSIVAPSFDPGIVHFVKKGGIYAFANIRGGGDKGIEWAEDGRGENKQNSFDDFISAAEFLIENKYTNSSKLAITGASNGGLVVAVAAIQRPDLFKAVVPIVAPLDMIRFEKFTIGHWHIDEYGTVTDSLGFTRLLSYSPYHNIKETINYPTMLVVTSENDDRVPPFHSYKFVAKLQNRIEQQNPIFLKIEKKSGHYGASTLYSGIREMADIYGFIIYELME